MLPTLIIQQRIHIIRNQQVMLDADLAELYQIETRVLNQAVKRNIKRFPSDFMFQLSKDEWTNLRSQFVTSSWGGTRKLPFAFTEQGVAMLSSILNSDTAIEVNIAIMRTFVAVRQMVSNTTFTTSPAERIEKLEHDVQELKEYMEEVFTDQNDINEDTRTQLELINQALAELQAAKRRADEPRNPIGFIKPKQ
ncbi:ORF6N domain-containing protein [Bacteroides sp. ET71]|uniref:ORF6N domain-containing protein n=1 Tax=Bacteroides sp. ET71 TaxID=2939421 RepID=UPI002012E9B4|nr:ORF6N domain-containing protein [Bacteroides sp. ET71]MCL1617125.1 ORF6N domain-containing protein [Bacteroides sp. ET71]